MVYTRINEHAENPNSNINFISALPPIGVGASATEDEEARKLLRALAAQLKPVMRKHGFTVNSFEEYESNKVFLGRNWNNGETVEIVLRDSRGLFYPTSKLLSVFCHELAHIKYMDHSAAFHTLCRQLSEEVYELQRKGYYGDGYWSSGIRLSDSQQIFGEGRGSQELPEYTCGGAYSHSRHSALSSRPRRRQRRATGPSLHTGMQTTKQSKAGSRVTSKAAFQTAGGGAILDERVEKGGKGSGFRKQAGSQRAREERAMAAERRLLQLQGVPPMESPQGDHVSDLESEGEEQVTSFERIASETDKERLKMMQDLMGEDDLEALRDDDDILIISRAGETPTEPSHGTGSTQDGEAKAAENNTGSHLRRQGQQHPSHTVSPAAEQGGGDRKFPESQGNTLGDKVKRRAEEDHRHAGPSKRQRPAERGVHSLSDTFSVVEGFTASSSSSLYGMAEQEMKHRKKETLGVGCARKLGERSTTLDKTWSCHLCTFANSVERKTCSMCEELRQGEPTPSRSPWGE